MIGALGGLGAALLWGTQNALNSRASRMVDPPTALFFTLLAGLLTVLPFAALAGWPAGASTVDWVWAGVAALCAVVGLGCLFAALSRAPLSLVLPIASAQGAAATVFAVLDGEPLSAAQGGAIVLVVVGVIVVATASVGAAAGPGIGVAIGFATATAVVIGFELFALGQAEAGLGPTWEILVLRGGGLLLVAVAFAARRHAPRAPRPALKKLALAGAIENAGFASYIIGTGAAGVAIPAVIASQFSVVGALIGVLLFRERLAPRQVAGIACIVAGVAAAILFTAA